VKLVEPTMSLKEIGAFKASAISCALALTLPLRVLIVLIASLRLGCLLCRDSPDGTVAWPLSQAMWLSLRCCHLSPYRLPLGFERGLGLGTLSRSSSCVTKGSSIDIDRSKSGNLNVSARSDEDDQWCSELIWVMVGR